MRFGKLRVIFRVPEKYTFSELLQDAKDYFLSSQYYNNNNWELRDTEDNTFPSSTSLDGLYEESHREEGQFEVPVVRLIQKKIANEEIGEDSNKEKGSMGSSTAPAASGTSPDAGKSTDDSKNTSPNNNNTTTTTSTAEDDKRRRKEEEEEDDILSGKDSESNPFQDAAFRSAQAKQGM